MCPQSERLVFKLAEHKARIEPPALQRSVQHSYLRRWWGLLSVAIQVAVAATLVPESLFAPPEWDCVNG